jgi:hypothetical protein
VNFYNATGKPVDDDHINLSHMNCTGSRRCSDKVAANSADAGSRIRDVNSSRGVHNLEAPGQWVVIREQSDEYTYFLLKQFFSA